MLAVIACSAHVAASESGIEELLVNAPHLPLESLELTTALTTFDREQLASANISHSSELVKLAPSLTTLQSFNNRQSAFLIRGLGTLIFSAGIEPSVITMRDGVSLGSAAQSMAPLLDMQRVEIWRGPQLSRFGRSAAAGVINLVSERASSEWQGRARLVADHASGLDSERVLASVFAGGPLNDALGVRMGLVSGEQQGFVHNAWNDQDLNNGRQQSAVVKFDWAGAPAMTAALDLDYSESRARCCVPIVSSVISGQIAGALQPVSASSRNIESNTNGDFLMNTRSANALLRLDKTIGEHSRIESVSAYSRYSEREAQDFDFLPLDLIPLSAGYDSYQQYSQHLRLETISGSRLTFALGAYFEKQTRRRQYARSILGIEQAEFVADIRQQTTAAYANTQFNLSERANLHAGLRFTHDAIEFTADREPFVLQGLAALAQASDSTQDHSLDAEVSLQYAPGNFSSVYLAWSLGHKAPAYNLGFDLDASALQAVDTERGQSFEVAYKRIFPAQQLHLAGTVFHTRFSDYQAQVQEPGSVKYSLINSGAIHSSGIELEASWRYQNLSLRAGIEWMRARIGRVDGILCGSGEIQRGECPGGARDLRGETLPFAPDLKANVSLGYQLGRILNAFNTSIDLLYRWQSRTQTAFNNDPYRAEPAFGLLDIGISAEAQHIILRMFVNNALNKPFALAHFDNPVDAGGYLSFFGRSSHRVVGLSAELNF